MVFNLKGTVTQKTAIETIATRNGDVTKQGILINQKSKTGDTVIDENFYLETLKPESISVANVGDTVEVTFAINSREYNGKYYTNLKLLSCKNANPQPTAAQAAPTTQVAQSQEVNDDLPF